VSTVRETAFLNSENLPQNLGKSLILLAQTHLPKFSLAAGRDGIY
jgi:hypothetical protein